MSSEDDFCYDCTVCLLAGDTITEVDGKRYCEDCYKPINKKEPAHMVLTPNND